MRRICFAYSVLFFTASFSFAQSTITLQDIYAEGTFLEKKANDLVFHPNGRHFARLQDGEMVLYNLEDGKKAGTLYAEKGKMKVSGFSFSPQGNRLLLQTDPQAVYRRSVTADYWIYDTETGHVTALFPEGKQRYATFSPDGQKVAFVYENNLYYRDLTKEVVVQVSTDGAINRIINGAADWVYEEEFSLTQAYAWSPDGRFLAWLRFDETEVPSFTLTNYRGEANPEYLTYKYPKAGRQLAVLSAHVQELATKKTTNIELGKTTDQYFPRLGWIPATDQVYLFRMNRHQNQLSLLAADPVTGLTRPILEEKDRAYLKLHDNLHFLPDGQHFIWTSEREGWNHLFLYNLSGQLIRQITDGEWEVHTVYGYDPNKDLIYYQSSEVSPLERQVYSISPEGKGKKQLTGEAGWNTASFAPGFQYFLHTHSTINTPPTFAVANEKGSPRYVLEENNALKVLQRVYKTLSVNFWQLEMKNGEYLNGWMIKPPGFKETQPYPVIMYVYGGPGSQKVTNQWNAATDYWWLQMMAQNGYLVACVDNRGTGARGAEFQKQTYLHLGKYETEDQLEAARYLARQPYVDGKRIGIYGKSYGGYLAALCLLRGSDVFAAGIALAPVTHWQWYDAVYTERYMQTVEENPAGYRESAPVLLATQLVDPFLLVHGLGDDNVHFQHTAEMANALVAANKQFETYFYPNVNHSLSGGNTRLHLFTRMTDFLDQHLRETTARAERELYYPQGQINRNNIPMQRSDMIIKKKNGN